MDPDKFKDFAREMAKFIANYMENIKDMSTVNPGYMRSLLPFGAAQNSENRQDIMADIEKVIMPGIIHWHHPNFHGYFFIAQSYPAIVADMMSEAFECVKFSWIASPACTELEIITLDWLEKMIDLPKEFLACSGGKGGGVIRGSASESTLITLLGAKSKKLKHLKEQHPECEESDIIGKLVAFSFCEYMLYNNDVFDNLLDIYEKL